MHTALDEIESNTSDNEHFSDVLAVNRTRRQLLQGGFSLAAMTLIAGTAGCARPFAKPGAAPVGAGLGPRGSLGLLAFQAVATSTQDAVRVPAGYSVQVLYGWGDPISDGPAKQPDASAALNCKCNKRACISSPSQAKSITVCWR